MTWTTALANRRRYGFNYYHEPRTAAHTNRPPNSCRWAVTDRELARAADELDGLLIDALDRLKARSGR